MKNIYTLVGFIVCLLLATPLSSQALFLKKSEKNAPKQPVSWTRLNNRPCERFYFQFVQICEGQKFRVVDSFYTKAGSYTNVMQTAEGCDSTINTFLTIIPSQRTDTSATVCLGKCFKVGTKCYSQAGNYADTLKTRFGCDSIIKLKLTIAKPDSTEQNPVICAGDSIKVGTHTYKTSGNYRDTVPNADGCFRLIKTNLTVRTKVTLTQNPMLCQGGSIKVGIHVYNKTGVYLDTLKALTGCDSLITTNLTVSDTFKKTIDTVVCSGKGVLFADTLRKETGVYKKVFRTVNGCDSTVILNLTVPRPNSTLSTVTLCSGKDTVIDGRRYNQSTTFRDTLKAINGCDSLVKVLTIIVLPPIQTTINLTFCRNETALTAGTTTKMLKAINGCDSLVITNIKINDTFNIRQTKEICAGDSLRVGNKFYKVANNYTDLLKTTAGCDSTVFTNLKTLAPLSITQSKTICKGDSIRVGNKIYKTEGVFVDKLTSSNGCDSVVTTTLKLNALPLLTLPQGLKAKFCGDSLDLNPSGDTASRYVWAWKTVPCPTCRNPKIKPVFTNTFYVTVTDKTTMCVAKDSVKVTLEGTYTEKIPNAFTPNSDNVNEVFNIVPDDCVKSVARLQIYSRWGNLIYDKTNLSPRNNEGWNGIINEHHKIGSDVYVYIMEIVFTDGTTKKVTGEVSLIH